MSVSIGIDNVVKKYGDMNNGYYQHIKMGNQE